MRSTTAQFRCGTLPVCVEKGRICCEPLAEESVLFLTLDEIETEQLFLLKCPLFDDLDSSVLDNTLGAASFNDNDLLVFKIFRCSFH